MRILVPRIRPVMAAHLQHIILWRSRKPHPRRGIASPGHICTRRKAGTNTCILSLDFHNAFDRIAHDYLFHNLQSYGIRPDFIVHLRAMYSDSSASVQINDTIAGTIPIQSGVWQGFPQSMALYALCLHPFLSMLDHSLQGLQVGRGQRCRSVLVYADDVAVITTHPTEFATIRQAIHCFEKVTGTQLNPSKSKGMALVGWKAPALN